MGRALKYVVLVVVLVPLALFAFVFGRYSWDSFQAGRVMRAHMNSVEVGDSRSDVESAVADADAAAINPPFGDFTLDHPHASNRGSADETRWIVKGFWLRTGITCYAEFVVEDAVVAERDDIYCQDDGWFE